MVVVGEAVPVVGWRGSFNGFIYMCRCFTSTSTQTQPQPHSPHPLNWRPQLQLQLSTASQPATNANKYNWQMSVSLRCIALATGILQVSPGFPRHWSSIFDRTRSFWQNIHGWNIGTSCHCRGSSIYTCVSACIHYKSLTFRHYSFIIAETSPSNNIYFIYYNTIFNQITACTP